MYKIISFLFLMLSLNVYAQNTLNSTGNVGIGTNAPIVRLQVQKESAAPAIMIGGGYPGSPSLQIYGLNDDSNAWMGLGVDMGGYGYEHSIYFPTGPSNYPGRLNIGNYDGSQFQSRLTVLANGNLGIGTVNPQSLLHVAGATLMGDNLKVLGKDGAWVEGVLVVKPSGWGGLRLARNDPAIGNYDGNWAIGYNASTGNDFSISNSTVGGQSDYIFHINAQTKNIGIGTASPSEKLSVYGTLKAREVKVMATGWPDYVFDQDYKVLGLQELDAYIKANKHLPEMPSAKEVEANGVSLGELVKLQQKKIEELTLHLIEKDKALTSTQKKLIQLTEAHQKFDLINANILNRLAEAEKNIKAINPKKLN